MADLAVMVVSHTRRTVGKEVERISAGGQVHDDQWTSGKKEEKIDFEMPK